MNIQDVAFCHPVTGFAHQGFHEIQGFGVVVGPLVFAQALAPHGQALFHYQGCFLLGRCAAFDSTITNHSGYLKNPVIQWAIPVNRRSAFKFARIKGGVVVPPPFCYNQPCWNQDSLGASPHAPRKGYPQPSAFTVFPCAGRVIPLPLLFATPTLRQRVRSCRALSWQLFKPNGEKR